MRELRFIGELAGFAPGAVLVGEGRRADCVWTRQQFIALCEYMRNDNPPDEFLHAYRDADGIARFVKSRDAKVTGRITWSWDTITGRAKHKIAIGFYPWNKRRQSRWAAVDFDAHDGDAARAKTLAVAGLQVLLKNSDLSLILCTSGSGGWHLFILSEQFHSIEDWVLLLKRIVAAIGAEVQSGRCEIFPTETRVQTSRPHAIRAPGTWNPKTNEFGAIFFESVKPLLQRLEKKEESSFLYRSSTRDNGDQLNDSDPDLYTGGHEDWQEQFRISEAGTRHAHLRQLVYSLFRQVSYRVARLNAERQYRQAEPRPNATVAEHLQEFEKLWDWMQRRWESELTAAQRLRSTALSTPLERDLFRILANFAKLAAGRGEDDFPFPVEHVADRLGASFQHVSKLRQRFVEYGLIEQTQPALANRCAARFRWLFTPSPDHGRLVANHEH